jgi:hypothetical protein
MKPPECGNPQKIMYPTQEKASNNSQTQNDNPKKSLSPPSNLKSQFVMDFRVDSLPESVLDCTPTKRLKLPVRWIKVSVYELHLDIRRLRDLQCCSLLATLEGILSLYQLTVEFVGLLQAAPLSYILEMV